MHKVLHLNMFSGCAWW